MCVCGVGVVVVVMDIIAHYGQGRDAFVLTQKDHYKLHRGQTPSSYPHAAVLHPEFAFGFTFVFELYLFKK